MNNLQMRMSADLLAMPPARVFVNFEYLLFGAQL